MDSRPATLRSRRVCRFCLSENEPLTFIYDRDISRPFQVPLPLQIMSCVSIEVYSADGMPQMICNSCRRNLDRSYKFKIQCKKADEALRNYPSSGILPRPFPPIEVESEGTIKRSLDSRIASDQPAKKSRLDNGSQSSSGRKVHAIIGHIQKQEDHRNIYEEQDGTSDPENDANHCRDESQLEPGEIRVHACDQCDRTFPLLQSLQLHVQQAHRDRNFKCTECDRMFFTKYDLTKHMQTHSEDKPHVCQVCNKQFSRANLLQRHEKIHREEVRYACGTCGREFFTTDELEKHEETIHKQVKPYQCNICGKRFTYKQGLERHEMLHNEDKSFVCEYCKEAFRTSNKLARHLQTHAGHRPYVCKMCPKTFLLSHHLTRHMRSHNVEKNHQCEDCGKAFKRKESLEVHQLTHMKRTGMGLTCSVCQETCRNRADYVTHIKQHIEAGEKMGSDGLPGDKENVDTEEDDDEEEEPFSDGDDDYQPPSYVAKKLPKYSKPPESEEEMMMAIDKDGQDSTDQVIYVRGKDGSVVKKTIKTLMPVKKPNTPLVTGKIISEDMRIIGGQDDTEAQVQKIVASVFKEHKIPLKNNSPLDQNKIKEENTDIQVPSTPRSHNSVKVIKRIVVKKTSPVDSSLSSNSTTQIQPQVPKVTKRVIVRRIIRQGDTTREVIMNPDGTLIDPAELARLPQGNVVKRVVVKKPLDKAQHIAAMLVDGDSKQYLKLEGEEMQKLINSSSPITTPALQAVTTSNVPKIITVQRLEPSQNKPQVISKEDQETKEKLEQLEKRVEQQRLKIEELQAKKQQQQEYDNDDMLPERHDDGSDEEQQLPLKRVFVKRKQCIYDEEKEYSEASKNLSQEVILHNEPKEVATSPSEEEKPEDPKLIVIKSLNQQPADVDEMSRQLCSILDSTENVVKMQETVLNNLTEMTSIEINSHGKGFSERNIAQDPMREQMEGGECEAMATTTDSNHGLKIVITQNNAEEVVKLQFEDSQENSQTLPEETTQSESVMDGAQALSESTDIFETSETTVDEGKSETLEESVIELSATNETINLNETTDSRDSLEDKLSQMEG